MDDRGAAPAFGAVSATVLAVLATLALPHWLSAHSTSGQSVPRPAAPSNAPALSGTRPWQSVRCAARADDGCAVPASLDHVGLLLHSVGGRRLVWAGRSSAAPVLVWKVPRSRSDRWVLVGGRSAGARSHVVVEVARSSPVEVSSDRLSLFALRGHARTTVTVTDRGQPFLGEVLRIEEYVER